MKQLFIIPFVFAAICAKGQQLAVDNIGLKNSLSAVNTFPLKKLPKPTPYFLDGQPEKPCSTFKRDADAISEPVLMRREAMPGELMSEFSPTEMEEQVSVYTTHSSIGGLKFSCDYMYNDEGRLIEAEPCWQWGK